MSQMKERLTNPIIPEYGVTRDGLMAARVDYLGLIAIPVGETEEPPYRVARRPAPAGKISDWMRDSVHVFGDETVTSDTDFRSLVDSIALEINENAARRS